MSSPESFALAFPGQGSQFVGMGEAVARASNGAYQIYLRANKALGFNIMRHCFEDPEGRLAGDASKDIKPDTKIIQPAIVTTGLAYMEMLREGGVTQEQFAAGHSLGQWTAAGAEKVIDIEDAVTLAATRGINMGEQASQLGARVYLAMAKDEALLRQKLEELGQHPEVRKILASLTDEAHSWQVTVANTATRFVIGGLEKHTGILEFLEGIKLREYDAAPLSHHPLMEPAQSAFNTVLGGIKSFANPYRPILDDMSGALKRTAEEVVSPFKQHMITGISWQQNEQMIARSGAQVLEVGGDILTKYASKDVAGSYHPLKTFEQVVEAIGRFGTPRVTVTV